MRWCVHWFRPILVSATRFAGISPFIHASKYLRPGGFGTFEGGACGGGETDLWTACKVSRAPDSGAEYR
ncbi:hypothetical protein PF008_g18375 [Phytophthora fragariae]|uniref:Secreted protein n=1 Tax=Phytophthora fragariae TaxID=53985 RepID=A0A6G0R5I8_9STRA|nr:hypothetical protein PF008_g18375 [Phytophthora fragariae]